MSKLNCWEFFNCGREAGGEKVHELGICPAAIFDPADGFLDGNNAGKACAYVAGTFCSGTIQGTAREKEKNCAACEFYNALRDRYGSEVSLSSFLQHIKDKEGEIPIKSSKGRSIPEKVRKK